MNILIAETQSDGPGALGLEYEYKPVNLLANEQSDSGTSTLGYRSSEVLLKLVCPSDNPGA